jgi:hypothetical protein
VIAFLWAVVLYIIDLAVWIVWLIISLMEFVCWALALALIVHAFNTVL